MGLVSIGGVLVSARIEDTGDCGRPLRPSPSTSVRTGSVGIVENAGNFQSTSSLGDVFVTFGVCIAEMSCEVV